MTNDLLTYYNDELIFLRKLGVEFADVHPNIAGKLKLGPNSIEDPFVEHLIESLAFLTARIRRKIDDNYPEISQTLLNILYPHYLSPIPSMSILQFKGHDSLTAGHTVKKHTLIETKTHDEIACRFQTVYPVTLWPIELVEAQLHSSTLTIPIQYRDHEAKSSLKLILQCKNKDMNFSTLSPQSLRFFINADTHQASRVYKLLFNHFSYGIITNKNDRECVNYLPNNCIKAVGFTKNENILPRTPTSLNAYRLLTEFFSFSEKFLFFDLIFDDIFSNKKFNNTIEVLLCFNIHDDILTRYFTNKTLALGCTPIINLFEYEADSFILTQEQSLYHLIPDRHGSLKDMEVHSILEISTNTSSQQKIVIPPLFGIKHYNKPTNPIYWHTTRKLSSESGAINVNGQEVYLSFINGHLLTSNNQQVIIHSKLLCSNRDEPMNLPFSQNEPQFYFWENSDENVNSMQSLHPMSPTIRLSLLAPIDWELISHLSLNHLSLTQDTLGRDALCKILQLYRSNTTRNNDVLIECITQLSTRRITTRYPLDKNHGFCFGTEITIEIDDDIISIAEFYCFACVLNYFFGTYCSINSFTQLILRSKKQGLIARWEPVFGKKPLC